MKIFGRRGFRREQLKPGMKITRQRDLPRNSSFMEIQGLISLKRSKLSNLQRDQRDRRKEMPTTGE